MCTDATHLERNLGLAFELKEYPIPIIYCLNLMDVAERQGIKIDAEKLAEELGSPVIPTVAIKNQGLRELMQTAVKLSKERKDSEPKLDEEEKWNRIKEIVSKVQAQVDKELTFIEKLEDWTIQPWPGIPIAILVLIASLGVVVGAGKL